MSFSLECRILWSKWKVDSNAGRVMSVPRPQKFAAKNYASDSLFQIIADSTVPQFPGRTGFVCFWFRLEGLYNKLA